MRELSSALPAGAHPLPVTIDPKSKSQKLTPEVDSHVPREDK
jgi:hypothetical protein